MATRAKQTYEQFSKRMARVVLIFWGVMRVLNFVVIALKPSVGTSLISLQRGADDIAMTIVLSYTANSLGEKVTLQVASGYFSRKRSTTKEKDDKEDEKENNNG